MQDLRSIPDTSAPTYQDPLYLEDQVPHRRPPIGEWAEGWHPPCRLWLPPRLSPRPSDCVNAQLCLPGFPFLHAGYRSGALQDSDTEDECWSDTGAVPQPSARPREKPLSRSQSLRIVKRKPLVREVSGQKGVREVSCPGTSAQTSHGVSALSPTGHLTLPEGPDKEKDCAFRHGQLGQGPCPVLPHALQGAGAIWSGLLAAHRACLPQCPGSALLAPAVG